MAKRAINAINKNFFPRKPADNRKEKMLGLTQIKQPKKQTPQIPEWPSNYFRPAKPTKMGKRVQPPFPVPFRKEGSRGQASHPQEGAAAPP